jgi:hypothetical protein
MSLRFTLTVAAVALGSVSCDGEEAPPKGASPPDEDAKVVAARERCAGFAARMCESAAPCCEQTTGAIVVEDCTNDMVTEFCGNAVQLVAAGVATYNADSEDACLAAWSRAHAICDPDWDEFLEINRDVWAACKIVVGTFQPGQNCTSSSQCAQPAGPSAAHCVQHPVTKMRVCQVVEILGEGAECPFPSGDVSLCDVGLYCTAPDLGETGVCQAVVPEGEPCDPNVAKNSECGLGNYCGRDDAVCHHAVNFGGPSCEQDAECVSFVCDRNSTGGSCRDVPPIAQNLCETSP